MKVMLVGASGLTGSFVLQYLLKDPRCSQVICLVRRQLNLDDPKLVQLEVDFDELETVVLQTEAAIITLGTTRAKAGSAEAFRKVDLEYVIASAQLAKKAGANRLAFMSSIGANAHSSVLYTRTKGEAEAQLQQLGFEQLFLLRPSILTGPRQETRIGERIGIGFMQLFGPLFLGSAKKYRAIAAEKVAAVLVDSVLRAMPGTHVLESDQIQDWTPENTH